MKKTALHDTRKYSFAVLAQSEEFLHRVREWADGRRYDLQYAHIDTETAVPVAHSFLEAGVEAVLYEGGPRNAIAKALGAAAMPIVRTEIDIINTIKAASAYSNELIYTMYSVDEHNISDLEELLQVKLHALESDTYEKLSMSIQRLFNEGQRFLVGGHFGKAYIEELGGTGFFILPGVYSINKAFLAAERYANNKRAQYLNRNNLFTMFQQLDEAVVCIDEDEELLFATPKAYEYLKLSPDAPPSELKRFFSTLRLRETLEDMTPRKNIMLEALNEQFLLTTIPHIMTMGRRSAMVIFRDASTIQQMNRKIGEHLYSKGFTARYTLDDFLGNAPCVRALKSRVSRFAPTEAAVCIHGETGTGKELLAHALHAGSKRRGSAFVAVNCAAMPESLIESELFGYEGGAFTGAQRGGKPGLFELAHKGTLFLDEIGEMSHEMQLRLLRVLEAREVMRLGGRRVQSVDVRIICASHKQLSQLVAAGSFRQDLYYRVGTLKLHVPPLRERPEDIGLLVSQVLQKNGKPPGVISPSILRAMKAHSWPGNIRELLATVESYCLLLKPDLPDEKLFTSILAENALPASAFVPEGVAASLDEAIALTRHTVIKDALVRNGGDKAATARQLGISYSKLWRLLQQNDKT